MTDRRLMPWPALAAAILFAGLAAPMAGDARAQAYYPDHGPAAPTTLPPAPPPIIVLPPTVPSFEAPPVAVSGVSPVTVFTTSPALDAFRGDAVVIADDEKIGVRRAPELVALDEGDSGSDEYSDGNAYANDWERGAFEMFPDSDCPSCDYQVYWEGIRAERDRFIREDAIPEGLQGMVGVPIVEYVGGRYRIELGFGTSFTTYVPSDSIADIKSGIAANMGEIKQLAAERATRLRELVEQANERAEYADGQDNEVWAESLRAEAADYESRLEGYTGHFLNREDKPSGTGASGSGGDGAPVAGDAGPGDSGPGDSAAGGPASDGPVADGAVADGPAPVADDGAASEGAPDSTAFDTDIVPAPTFDEPATIDAMLGGEEPMLDRFTLGDLAGENADIPLPLDDLPGLAADDIGTIDLSQPWSEDIGGGEAREGIDFTVERDAFAELARPIVDAGLAVAGTLVPPVGLAIAGTTNFKNTYDYAIKKGLRVDQAIFAATVAGTVGAGDAYVMDKGVGKIAGWTGKLLRWGGTKAGREALMNVQDKVVGDVMGTAGNAAGLSLLGDVGKRLVDGMAANTDRRSYLELSAERRSRVDYTKVDLGYTGAGFGKELLR
jgi:hypothetical protein